MALQKSIEQDSGAVAAYWRIMRVAVDFTQPGQAIGVMVGGYLSRATRLAGKSPAAVVNLTAYLTPTDPDPRVQLYTALKAMDIFSGATDVLES